ncbi:MAG TPA: hypothetical protein PKN41_06760 [Bacteroidales bacterium]|nr:hypothetical protein [Bacteroidales bacterium]
MNRFAIIIIAVFAHTSFVAYCQHADSLVSRKDSIKAVGFCIQKFDTTTMPQNNATYTDTAIFGFHNYDPAVKSYEFFANLGNVGQATQNLIFRIPQNTGFTYGLSAFDAYKFNLSQNINLYSMLPYTNLFWTLGMKREQVFQVTHYHHVRNQVFMGVDYRIINSPGRDNFRQKTNNHALSVYTYYATKNKRYGVIVNYIFNRIKVQDNGGLNNDTAYINYRKGENSGGFDINLKKAETAWNESSVMLKQYVTLSRESDFNKKDSLRPLKKFNFGRIIHTLSFTRRRYKFIDENPNFAYYPLIPNDTSALNDSTWFYTLENTLAWTNAEQRANVKDRHFRYYARIKHAYTKVRQLDGSYYISNLIPSLGISVRPYNTLKVDVAGEYVLMDYNQNDFSLNATAKQDFVFNEKNYGALRLSARYQRAEPAWFYEHFFSKYYQWDYDFVKQSTLSLSLNYSYPRLSVGIDYYNLYNYVYLGADSRPRQYTNGVVNVLSAFIYKDFVFGKFRIDNKVVYQYTDKPALVRKPQLMAMQSYMFTTPMFKKALLAQIGIDLAYNSPYFADSYNPALGAFVLQNDYKNGNYLDAAVFINLKIQRMRIFVKLSNFLSGLIGYNYFTVPHYPMQDRLFRFGISWRFHD